eukprot:TRINITY_DN17554_c0_g1_i1.p1 TRINITY_DN17554_c0_g1~~TRINITY_DN17554_c0_g1_i1.p1  ORF type:complete len:127 (-),score=42.40 TRINITY_DN17554_c0_g1_i1:2-382(-)
MCIRDSKEACAPRGPQRDLPRVSREDKMYTSTALMLKKTRAEVESYSKDLGAVNMIADLPVSGDVRRLVARMYADPKNAEAISEGEWKRREQSSRMDRDCLLYTSDAADDLRCVDICGRRIINNKK